MPHGARGEELPEEFPYTQSVMERFPKTGQWIEDVAGVNLVPRMTLGNSFPFPLWDTFIPRIWAADTPIVPAVEAVVLGYDDAQVLYSTEVVPLIRDGEGRVAGVSAIGADGRPIAVDLNQGSWNVSDTALGPIDPAIYINMEGRRYAREAIGYSLIGLVTIGKPMEGMREIAEPPFYAFMVNPQHYATYGGVKVDLDGRVLDEADEAIPGLYAAGIVTGSFAEQEGLYCSGGVPQALACGMMVGENAATE